MDNEDKNEKRLYSNEEIKWAMTYCDPNSPDTYANAYETTQRLYPFLETKADIRLKAHQIKVSIMPLIEETAKEIALDVGTIALTIRRLMEAKIVVALGGNGEDQNKVKIVDDAATQVKATKLAMEFHGIGSTGNSKMEMELSGKLATLAMVDAPPQVSLDEWIEKRDKISGENKKNESGKRKKNKSSKRK